MPPKKLNPKPKVDPLDSPPQRRGRKQADTKPSNIKNQTPQAAQKTPWEVLAERLQWPEDGPSLNASHVASILKAGNKEFVPGQTSMRDIESILESKTPDEWKSELIPGYGKQAAAPAAAPAKPTPKAKPVAKAKPAAKPAAVKAADDPLAEGQDAPESNEPPEIAAKRQRLLDLGANQDLVNDLPAAQLDSFAVLYEKQASKGLTPPPRGAAATKPATAKPAATKPAPTKPKPAPAKPDGRRSAPGADKSAVTTNDETPPQRVPEAASADPLLEGLSSEQLYKLARQQQIREGMTPSAIVQQSLEGGDVKLPDLTGVPGLVDDNGVISTAPVIPGAARTPATASAPPVSTTPGVVAQSQGSAPPPPTPKDEPFFIMPKNPFGYDMVDSGRPGEPPVKKYRPVATIARNLPRVATWTGVGLGVPYGLYRASQAVFGGGSQQPMNESEMDASMQRAIEANERLKRKFGGYDDRPGADSQQPAGAIIRQLQGGR